MNGLLANNESESALLTSFMLLGKYFYINLHDLIIMPKNVVLLSKKWLTSDNSHVPRDILRLLPVGIPHSLFRNLLFPE